MRSILFAALVACTVPAAAQSPQTSVSAEAALVRQLRHEPDDHVAIANLARLYVKTKRPAKAQRLYRALLSMDDVELDRASGAPVSTHWLATQALKSMSKPRPLQLSSRAN